MADNVQTNKKRKDADTEAGEYLALQMSLREKSRFSNLLLIVLTLGFIFSFAVMFWIIPDNDFSPEENRSLAKAPEITLENFLSGKLTDEVSDYMADQFPFRNFFVGVKAAGEIAQVKLENNSVIIGEDDMLFARNDYPDEKSLSTNISSAAAFCEALDERGIPNVCAFAGRKIDVLSNDASTVYGSYCSDRIWNTLDGMANEAGLSVLNLRDSLREKSKTVDGLYYKTDHHWTSLGAYYGYCDIVSAFGEVPYELSDFTVETATEDFFGTTQSSSGVKWASADTIEYYRYDGDDGFTMKIESLDKKYEGYEGCTYETNPEGKPVAVFDSYFVREFLSEKDNYASFIGGNNGYTEIRKNGENTGRETLLVIKDSFSHSLVQFLSRHYDLVMIDLRYYKQSMLSLCENDELSIDKVLLMYNMETLTEDSYLGILKVGTN